jgi:hypothetical protein
LTTSRSVSVFTVKLSPGVQRSVRACTEPRMICEVQSYCVYRLASAGNFMLITPQKNTMAQLTVQYTNGSTDAYIV